MKYCPKCSAIFSDNSMWCPVCNERVGKPLKETAMFVVCPSCKGTVTPINGACPRCYAKIGSNENKKTNSKKKGFLYNYMQYEKYKASINAVLLPIMGVITLIASIIGAFFNLWYLFGLAFSCVFFILGAVNKAYYEG